MSLSKLNTTKLVRIFLGGRSGHSKAAFINALGIIQAKYGDQLKVEVLDTDMMKKDPFRFTPKQMIDWLLEADIHVIVGHLHQGNDHLCWDITELLKEYERLRGHVGYPKGALDPIFLQDKILYLLALDDEDHLPTLRIDLPYVLDGDEIVMEAEDVLKLIEFLKAHPLYKEFVVKAGFVTHGSPLRGSIYCKGFKNIIGRILRLGKLCNYVPTRSYSASAARVQKVPYLMIQPRVANTEYKVLVIGGKARYIQNQAYGFKSSIDEIFSFAERVTAKLKEAYPETMTDYIIRVDIFEVDGKLKLNEFESFDADFLMVNTMTKRRRKDDQVWTDCDSENFVKQFWLKKLDELVSSS